MNTIHLYESPSGGGGRHFKRAFLTARKPHRCDVGSYLEKYSTRFSIAAPCRVMPILKYVELRRGHGGVERHRFGLFCTYVTDFIPGYLYPDGLGHETIHDCLPAFSRQILKENPPSLPLPLPLSMPMICTHIWLCLYACLSMIRTLKRPRENFWTDSDVSLLYQLRSEMPDASYKVIADQFNARGPDQTRKPDAVRRKLNSSPPSEKSYYFFRQGILTIVERA